MDQRPAVQCEFETKKANRCIVFENYKFSERRTLRNGSGISFRCTNRKCKAKVLVDNRLETIIETMNMPHGHPALSDRTVARERIKCAAKRVALSGTSVRTHKIVQAEIERQPELARELLPEDVNLLRKSVNSARSKRFEPPKSCQQAMNQLYGVQTKILHDRNRFCFVNPERELAVFTCDTNLHHLTRSDVVYGDSAYRNYRPEHFGRFYAVHVFLFGAYYVPVAFCFMTVAADARQYEQLFVTLDRLCRDRVGGTFAPRTFYGCPDPDVWRAVRSVFPRCELRMCPFQVSRSWFRWMCNRHEPSRREYADPGSRTGRWLKCFFALFHLRPCQVTEAFDELVSVRPVHEMDFVHYVCERFVEGSAEYGPNNWAGRWSTYTDAIESFHGSIDERLPADRRSDIFQVIDVLKKIQMETDLKIYQARAGYIGQREISKNLKTIYEMWEKLKKNEISLLYYLNLISDKTHPKIT